MFLKTRDEAPMLGNAAARSAGIVLIAVTVLAVLAMAHHPSVTAPNIAQALEQIARMSDLSGWVHGVLIGVLLATLYVFTEFGRRRGLTLPLVRAGLIAYAVGVLAMIGAALVSGFVITQIASMTPQVTQADLQSSGQLLILCSVLNRTLANLGAVLMSAGILLWSIDLLRSPRLGRVLGILGILIAVLPVAALAFGALKLNVPGMTQVVLLQAVWNIGVGVLLIWGLV